MGKIPGTKHNNNELKPRRKRARTIVVSVNFTPSEDANFRLKKVMSLLLGIEQHRPANKKGGNEDAKT
jgi:hypothetical protein